MVFALQKAADEKFFNRETDLRGGARGFVASFGLARFRGAHAAVDAPELREWLGDGQIAHHRHATAFGQRHVARGKRPDGRGELAETELLTGFLERRSE